MQVGVTSAACVCWPYVANPETAAYRVSHPYIGTSQVKIPKDKPPSPDYVNVQPSTFSMFFSGESTIDDPRYFARPRAEYIASGRCENIDAPMGPSRARPAVRNRVTNPSDQSDADRPRNATAKD